MPRSGWEWVSGDVAQDTGGGVWGGALFEPAPDTHSHPLRANQREIAAG